MQPGDRVRVLKNGYVGGEDFEGLTGTVVPKLDWASQSADYVEVLLDDDPLTEQAVGGSWPFSLSEIEPL